MKCYLVGGAVRDTLLDRPVDERDWVVVGGTAEDMLRMGYHPVGKGFPVFLAPRTREEYALARRECKKGSGHTGFSCNAGTEVTLEQDLLRRDLTINAMAQPAEFHAGLARVTSRKIIDPWNGRKDLQARILRHVSPAFTEDPLRVLRVARFSAQLYPWGFRIAPETEQLMTDMANSGELDHLTPERIWRETELALKSSQPGHFFSVLAGCHALDKIFPELAGPGDRPWEDSLGSRITADALESSTRPGAESLFAILTVCASIERIEDFTLDHAKRALESLKTKAVPKGYLLPTADLGATLALVLKPQPHPEDILALFTKLGLFRQPRRFHKVVQVLQQLNRTTRKDWPLNILGTMAADVQAIQARTLRKAGLDGAELGAALQEHRCKAIARWLPAWQDWYAGQADLVRYGPPRPDFSKMRK